MEGPSHMHAHVMGETGGLIHIKVRLTQGLGTWSGGVAFGVLEHLREVCEVLVHRLYFLNCT